MIVENAFQIVREHFPELPFALFLNKLNRAVQEFIQETAVLRVYITGTITSGSTDIVITSPAAQTLSSSGTGNQLIYAIPTYLYTIESIRFYNSDGIYLDSPVTFLINNDRIEFFNTDGEPLEEWPSDVVYIQFYGAKTPASLTATTDTIGIPDQFCEALTARILMDQYAIGKGALLQLSGWWRSEYIRIKTEAKRYGNTQRDRVEVRGTVGELLATDPDKGLIFAPEDTSPSTTDGGTF